MILGRESWRTWAGDGMETDVQARIVVEAPIRRIWHALTEPEGLRSWLCTSVELHARGPTLSVGDEIVLRAWHLTGRWKARQIDAPGRLIWEGNYEWPLPDNSQASYALRTTFQLHALQDARTEVSVSVAGLDDDEGGQFGRDVLDDAWRRMLVNLKTVQEFGCDLRAPLLAYPRIGLVHATLHPSRFEQTGAREGNYAQSVWAEGPAGQAGIQPGDVIAAVDEIPTPTYAAYQRAVASRRPGDTFPVDVIRRGQRLRLVVTLPAVPPGGRERHEPRGPVGPSTTDR